MRLICVFVGCLLTWSYYLFVTCLLYYVFGWLVVCLGGWLFDWMVALLFTWFLLWVSHWFVGWLWITSLEVARLFSCLIGLLLACLVDLLLGYSVVDWVVGQLFDKFCDYLIPLLCDSSYVLLFYNALLTVESAYVWMRRMMYQFLGYFIHYKFVLYLFSLDTITVLTVQFDMHCIWFEASVATACSEVFSSDHPCQYRVSFRRFGDYLLVA
jgi:hypothetical protein